jgi:hypothetical protein
LESTVISKKITAFTLRVEVSQARDQQEAGCKQSVSPKRRRITTGLYVLTAQNIALVILININTSD